MSLDPEAPLQPLEKEQEEAVDGMLCFCVLTGRPGSLLERRRTPAPLALRTPGWCVPRREPRSSLEV